MSIIRAASCREGYELTKIALRSKAYWGYDQEFLDKCSAALTVSPDYIRRHAVFVFENDGLRQGFCSLEIRKPIGELGFLFVDVPFIGKGVGSALIKHVLAYAKKRRLTSVLVESDPNARGFYQKHGFYLVRMIDSPLFPGRQLPLLEHDLGEK